MASIGSEGENNKMKTPPNWKEQLDEIIGSEGENNNYCADCFVNSSASNWGVWNHGIFVCIQCAGIHRQIGVHISKVKSTEFDKWRSFELNYMLSNKGNNSANKKHKIPKYFINPSECDGVQQVRKYFIQQKYEFKLFETDLNNKNKDDVVICDMPQNIFIGTFLYENNKKKVYLQLLHRTLYQLKNSNDSYYIEKFDVVNDLQVTLSQSDSVYSDFVLNIYKDANDLLRIRPLQQNNTLYLIQWVHYIRRAHFYYKYLDSIEIEQKNASNTDDNTPFTEISIQQLEEATILAIASKKGGGAKVWRKRWWILLHGFLYYFKGDFRRNKKSKGIGIPQGHISLSNADIIWDNDRTRSGKQHAFMICTPQRTFYIQPQQHNKDTFFNTVHCCCTKYSNPQPFDFVNLSYL